MQLIDGKTCELASFTDFHGLLEQNKNGQEMCEDSYILVAIIGPQCSGKSTFLNAVFGSDFPTLSLQACGEKHEPTDGNRLGQVQTTRGTWISPIHLQIEDSTPLYLLIDNEGCDGRERFGDALFERKSTLFSLALADVLIINMWTSDVGRFAASNLSLFQTIIEIYLPQFRPGQSQRLPFKRPILMFILRDHTSGSLSQHRENIREGLQHVLDDALISNCEGSAAVNSESMKLDDTFDVRVYSFPHYILQRWEFDEKIDCIRNVFNPYSETFVLNQQSLEDNRNIYVDEIRERARNFPLNGLYSYMKACWEIISRCKELDLPTRKQITAEIRCEELMRKIVKPAIELKQNEWLQNVAEEMRIPNIEKEIQLLFAQSVEVFLQYTSHYPDSVTKKYLEEIEEQMPKELRHALFPQIVELLTSKFSIELRVELKSILEKSMRKQSYAWKHLRTQVRDLKKKVIQPFLIENVASGYIQEKDENETKENRADKLYWLIEKKLESTIRTEIQSQLLTFARMDELPVFMIQLFTDAYERKLSEVKFQEKHSSPKDHALVDEHLIDIAKTVVHVGVDYFNNIYLNRYTSTQLPEEDCMDSIHYEVQFELTPLKQDKRNLVVKLSNISINAMKSNKQGLIETSADRLLGQHCVTVQPSDVQQALRLYFQGVSHVIEVQREKAHHFIQQVELSRKQKHTFGFLWEIPLWFWLVIFFFMMESFVELLTSSAFWILLFFGCYCYFIPLQSSQGLSFFKNLFSRPSQLVSG